MELIAAGKAPRTVQPTEGATYDPMLNKRELRRVDFSKLSGQALHNFIRGMDKVPGAWITLEGQVRLTPSSARFAVSGHTCWLAKPYIPHGNNTAHNRMCSKNSR